MTLALAAVAVLAAYLIGSIPFAFVVVRAVKGVDIRTVGSGNVGATNAGRVLGFGGFLGVFALDLLKGFLPTWLFPMALTAIVGEPPGGTLRVLVALATILGHNFPVYLRFRGGKGVATSLGALLALEPLLSLATAAAFVMFLLVTKYVSMSSLLGGCVFFLLYFGRTEEPWSADHAAMSLLTVGLLGMLFVRHAKNLRRIWSGTEPRVTFGRRKAPPSGRASAWLVVALAAVAGGAGLAWWMTRPAVLDCGPLRLEVVGRLDPGHQRAERVVFADGGRLLAATCPRYNRVVLYDVGDAGHPVLVRDIALDGRPVAVRATADRLYVLQRPAGDARHVEEAWWDTFDLRGRPVGSRFRVGFDPDDLALTADGRWAFVLLSGSAEGETNRPGPELISVDLRSGGVPQVVGRLAFERPGDDPERLALSSRETAAVVSLLGTDEAAAIDLADPARPRLAGRSPLPEAGAAYLSVTPGDWILMPSASPGETALLPGPRGDSPLEGMLVRTLPEGSGLEVVDPRRHRVLGRLALRGPGNLSGSRPLGIAYRPEGGELLAVANRQGGSIFLVAVHRSDADGTLAAAGSGDVPRSSATRARFSEPAVPTMLE